MGLKDWAVEKGLTEAQLVSGVFWTNPTCADLSYRRYPAVYFRTEPENRIGWIPFRATFEDRRGPFEGFWPQTPQEALDLLSFAGGRTVYTVWVGDLGAPENPREIIENLPLCKEEE